MMGNTGLANCAPAITPIARGGPAMSPVKFPHSFCHGSPKTFAICMIIKGTFALSASIAEVDEGRERRRRHWRKPLIVRATAVQSPFLSFCKEMFLSFLVCTTKRPNQIRANAPLRRHIKARRNVRDWIGLIKPSDRVAMGDLAYAA